MFIFAASFVKNPDTCTHIKIIEMNYTYLGLLTLVGVVSSDLYNIFILIRYHSLVFIAIYDAVTSGLVSVLFEAFVATVREKFYC